MDNTDYRSQIEIKNRKYTFFDITPPGKKTVSPTLSAFPIRSKSWSKTFYENWTAGWCAPKTSKNIARWQKTL